MLLSVAISQPTKDVIISEQREVIIGLWISQQNNLHLKTLCASEKYILIYSSVEEDSNKIVCA